MEVDKNEIWDYVNILRTANTKNTFGLGPNFYRNEMKWMKDLRNHIHIQSPAAIAEADYAIYENIDILNRSKRILVYFLQRALIMKSSEMHEVFYFLEPTADFVHTKNAQTKKRPLHNMSASQMLL